MKRKKIFLLLFIACSFASIHTIAQTKPIVAPLQKSKWSVRIFETFGFATRSSYNRSRSVVFFDYSNVSIDPVTKKITAPPLTQTKYNRDGYGESFRIGAGLVYELNEVIDFGIDAEWYARTKNNIPEIRSNFQELFAKVSYERDYSYKVKMLIITPAISMKYRISSDVTLYTKLGMAIGAYHAMQEAVGGHYTPKYTQTPKPGYVDSSYLVAYTYTNKLPVGISSGIGIKYDLSKKIKAQAELNYINMTFNPLKRVLTKLIENRNDNLRTAPLQKKITEYVEYDIDTPIDGAANFPKKEIRVPRPLISIGFGLSFSYQF